MPGIGGALDIARITMYASQLALEVTSHNISNANTEGYSKQKLEVQTNLPIRTAPGEIGTGVRATTVSREHDDFITEQVNLKTSQYYYWQATSEAMGEIETIFNESDDYGLNKIMGEFWSAWGDLANNPDGTAERSALLAKTDNLVQFVQEVDYNLREYQRHLDSSIRGSVDQINSITQQIADLNTQITSVEIKGSVNANDLRDQRDKLLGQLAEYMDITYYEEESSGQVMVFVMGGTPLVLGKDAYTIDEARNTTTGYTDLFWEDTSGRTINLTSPNKLEGGKVAGWVDTRDTKIDSYLDTLNTMTDELVWQVNSLCSEGVGLQSVTSMVGTVTLSATDDLSNDFHFSNGYNAGGKFDIVVYDSLGNVANAYTIDPASSTDPAIIADPNSVGSLVADITNRVTGGEVTASVTNGHFQIQANGSYTFVVRPTDNAESSNALAIMGVNTFFNWAEDTNQPVTDITQTIGINPAVTADSDLIAAGYLDNDNKVAPGDNSVALGISELKDKVIPNIGGTGISSTIDAFYSSFIAEVGVDVQNAEMNEQFNDTLMGQYIQKKESITGVNLDEEMADILQNQYLYQAAAKLISICDEMMQSLLSVQ